MSKTPTNPESVKAMPVQGLRVLATRDRPDYAILELQVKGGARHYLVPRERLRAVGEHFIKQAQSASALTKADDAG